MSSLAPVVFLGLLAAARPDPQVRTGRQLFHDPSIGTHGVACARCHSTAANEAVDGDGLLRSGFTLYGVARRPYWRGDTRRQLHARVSEAVDVCVQLFQGGKPLQGAQRRAMTAYLRSISPIPGRRQPRSAPAPRIKTALEADLNYDRSKYRGGDATRGRRLFYRACHGCHPHGQAGVAPSLVGASVADVAQAVREGNGLLRGARRPGAWSPPFGTNRLTHPQVADIAAFIGTLGSP